VGKEKKTFKRGEGRRKHLNVGKEKKTFKRGEGRSSIPETKLSIAARRRKQINAG
jgi:hypothetical protein